LTSSGWAGHDRPPTMSPILRSILIGTGALALLAAINFHPLLSPKTPGMRAYRSLGLTVHALPRDEGEAAVIAHAILQQRDRVARALNAVEIDVEVILYPDRKALHRKTLGLAGYFLPDWFIGDNTRRYVLITSPANPGPAHSRESVVRAAVHEYVHVLTDRRNRHLSYWLKEGLALYLAEQTPGADSIRSARDITYEEYANPNALQFADVGGYTLAYTLIHYLEDTFGWDRVVGLTAAGATVSSVLGLTERDLFDNWKAYLQGI
jgi:hypothetical protein